MSIPSTGVRRVAPALFVATIVLAASLVLAPASALAAVSGVTVSPQGIPSFTLNGAGYGHGIGLSQYGARGWANHDKSGNWIATYYYPGSIVGTVADRSVKVNLDDGKAYRSYWQIRPGHVGGHLLVDSKTTLSDATYKVQAVSTTQVRILNSVGHVVYGPASTFQVAETGEAPNLVQIIDGSGPYNHGYVRYRGKLLFTASGGKVACVNQLTMDNYLYGVVPRESPSSWPLEALQAQALCARSYAYVSSGTLYCTTRSQVYAGHSHGDRTSPTNDETARTNTAVDSTSGHYVKYGTSVVQAFFSSSSGGHTANIEDVWRGSTPKPYFKGVDDPYDAESSPYDPWDPPVKIDGKTMAAKLKGKTSSAPAGAGSTVWVKALSFDRADSGHVRDVTVTWSNGAKSSDITGDEMRSALGLRSTMFFIYYFPTSRVGLVDRYATSVEVSKRLYPSSGAGGIVVASGEDAKFADALTASGLAGVVHAPVLLVSGTSASTGVLAEVKRLKGAGASRLYVVGGTGSVSAGVQGAVEKASGLVATRLSGGDRYAVAAAVAREMKARGAAATSVLIASGEKWPDAALAGSLAAGTGRPVLLGRATPHPTATKTPLAELAPTNTMVIGGPATLPDAVVKQISPAPSKRFGATGDRFSLAAEIARWAKTNAGYTTPNVYLVTASRFPDSITGGVLAGHDKQPLLMTWPETLPGGTASFLKENRSTIQRVTIVGGTSSVGNGAYEGLCKALN